MRHPVGEPQSAWLQHLEEAAGLPSTYIKGFRSNLIEVPNDGTGG